MSLEITVSTKSEATRFEVAVSKNQPKKLQGFRRFPSQPLPFVLISGVELLVTVLFLPSDLFYT